MDISVVIVTLEDDSTTGVGSGLGLGLLDDAPPIRRIFCLLGVGEDESADEESEVLITERGVGGLDRVKAEETGGFGEAEGGCFGCVAGRFDEDRVEESLVNSSLGDARELLLEVR